MIKAVSINNCQLTVLYVPRKAHGMFVEVKYFKNVITVLDIWIYVVVKHFVVFMDGCFGVET
jgi:hypothetical protein